MTDGSRRLVGATCFLAALWVLVYWLWQPARPAISFARPEPEEPDPPRVHDREAVREPEVESPVVIRQGQASGPGSSGASIRDPLDTPVVPNQRLAAGADLTGGTPSVPMFRDYTIRDGDTFETIAARELGSRTHVDAVARANPLKDPRRLRVGDVIRLPLDPANIQGGPAPRPGQPGQPAEPGVRQAVANRELAYTVEPGDSLSKISQLFYGTVRHADLIFQANRDQLRSVDDIRAGQTLRIPPKPE